MLQTKVVTWHLKPQTEVWAMLKKLKEKPTGPMEKRKIPRMQKTN